MPNVKTAISIEKPIFEQMDIIAKNLNRTYFSITTKTKELKNNNKWEKIKEKKKNQLLI